MPIPDRYPLENVAAFLAPKQLHLVRENADYWYIANRKGRRMLRISLRNYAEDTPMLKFQVNSTPSSKEFPMTRPAQDLFAKTDDAFDWLDTLVSRFAENIGDYVAYINCGINDFEAFIERGYERARSYTFSTQRYVKPTKKEL